MCVCFCFCFCNSFQFSLFIWWWSINKLSAFCWAIFQVCFYLSREVFIVFCVTIINYVRLRKYALNCTIYFNSQCMPCILIHTVYFGFVWFFALLSCVGIFSSASCLMAHGRMITANSNNVNHTEYPIINL